MGLGIAILGMAMAIFSQKLIDNILPSKDFNKLITGIALVAFLLLIRVLFTALRDYFLIRQTKDFNNRIVDNFYSSLLNLPKPFFDTRKIGELVARLNDTFDSLHCMEFHPEYGAEDADLDFLTDNDWESSVDKSYCMIFIQDLEQVVRASDKLERLGYYKVYPESEYQELVVERKRRLQWL